ncbi:hypothetical protein [Paraglaciecola sp. L3A3]|uniref:hypothetical protein n=1 Tax=Paraglaciecola sp. L3A3 TaxID=2686358 RepID=UPI00131C19B5|nr:hypothetical protein [Paraglaciecola sp. L3A3]
MIIRFVSLIFISSIYSANAANAQNTLLAETLQSIQTFDARQGVAVDEITSTL